MAPSESASEKKAIPPQQWDSTSGVAEIEATAGSGEIIVNKEKARKVMRKLDIRIIPTIMWVYLMNMMDRVNIGNARLFGMEEDLGLKGQQFQLAVSVLFVTYCLFEAPSNLIIKKLQPARYLAGLTIGWGLIATFSAFVQNFAGLLVCRLLLGLFEAGFFPGVVLYLSMFYGRNSLALRIAYFFGTAAASGVIGGLIAYGISFMDGDGGWRAWRWIIVIEGVPTILTGILIPFVIPNDAESAKFLTDDDRQTLKDMHESELGKAHNLRNLVWSDVKDGVKDWTTWAFCFAIWPCLIMLYSFVVFLPTIIKALGTWNSAEVQALTVPVYAVGAILYLIAAYISDKTQRRGYFILVAIVFAVAGYGMLLANKSSALSYAGTFFVSIGIFTSTGISVAWVTANNPRYGKRAFAGGMQLTVGNSAGVASPFLFSSKFAPTYVTSYAVCMGMLGVSLILVTALHVHFRRQNKLRDEGKQDYLMEGKTEIEIDAMGEMSPRYRFST